MIVNLRCENCLEVYDFEVGKVSENYRGDLKFEKPSICPFCGGKDMDLLTEKGQSQMTAWFLDPQNQK